MESHFFSKALVGLAFNEANISIAEKTVDISIYYSWCVGFTFPGTFWLFFKHVSFSNFKDAIDSGYKALDLGFEDLDFFLFDFN